MFSLTTPKASNKPAQGNALVARQRPTCRKPCKGRDNYAQALRPPPGFGAELIYELDYNSRAVAGEISSVRGAIGSRRSAARRRHRTPHHRHFSAADIGPNTAVPSRARQVSVRLNAMRRRVREPLWAYLPDRELLDWRMCDLGVRIEGSPLEERVKRINEELGRRGLKFRPVYWLSEEWFSPDGVPGVAIPFYLAQQRLTKLEKRQMLEVEGGTRQWCLRILRHEVGHAIDNAYRLHRRRRWRELFGSFAQPYPEFYSPKPHSKRYVLHLDSWYAQSHPSEDFAETFAVWLRPARAGARNTKVGRRSRSWNTWTS